MTGASGSCVMRAIVPYRPHGSAGAAAQAGQAPSVTDPVVAEGARGEAEAAAAVGDQGRAPTVARQEPVAEVQSESCSRRVAPPVRPGRAVR
ncbi:hypothetical protein GCM10025734_10620 [Kitasatospora paranensis]